MEKVMSLPLHEDVQSLYRLLQAQGVRLLIVEENGEQVIYVESKEQAAAVQEAYSCYRTDHNMSQQVDRYWQKAAPLQRTPVIVWPTLLASPGVSLLLFSLLFVGVWTGFGRFDNHRDFLIVDRFHTDFMVDTHSVDVLWQLLLDGQFLRLLAPAWLHWSVLHWLFNSLGLWILGRSLENYLGFWAFLLLVLVSAIVANISQFLIGGAGFGGFSGVVFALVGAHATGLMLAPGKGCWAHPGIVGISIVWMFAAMLGVTEMFGIYVANMAHFMGFVCGVVWLTIVLKWRVRSTHVNNSQ